MWPFVYIALIGLGPNIVILAIHGIALLFDRESVGGELIFMVGCIGFPLMFLVAAAELVYLVFFIYMVIEIIREPDEGDSGEING